MMIDFPWQPIKYEGFGKKGQKEESKGAWEKESQQKKNENFRVKKPAQKLEEQEAEPVPA